jgi:hypothetical protein
MGIIRWWNDVWNKPSEIVEDRRKPSEKIQDFIENPIAQDKPLSDIDRVTNYKASGGEIVDLTNRPRKENDGFAPDNELLHPWNEAHTGMKDGLMRGGRR